MGKGYGRDSLKIKKPKKKKGLYANIHAKRERIAKGSGEKMRKPGEKGRPTSQNFRDAASKRYITNVKFDGSRRY